jgi:glycine cleavage system H lipoate-binding protein
MVKVVEDDLPDELHYHKDHAWVKIESTIYLYILRMKDTQRTCLF